ncbi:MAG: PglZ domain-containing protein [Bryobacterales bacterium]|nr:PglZ domain-containing protein [Bryobacterales bacterium]
MYPSEWAGNNVEILARHHAVVWVEDPYWLIEQCEIERLRTPLSLLNHDIIVAGNAFDLRRELQGRDPFTSKLVVIDQSYTLRDPHLAPRDARPGDLVPLFAPDWKPFVEKDGFFRPTVRDFLRGITDDDRWPVEVNIYPYEELARKDSNGFVRAYDSFRQTGRALTTEDLLLVGASAAFGTDLVDLSDPVLALGVAFHSEERWHRLSKFFNATEMGIIRRRLRGLPAPVGELFGENKDTARLAVTALLVLRQHFEEPGVHLPVLSAALAPFADATLAVASDPPAWFVDEEVPEFEKLITPKFTKYLGGVLKIGDEASARAFDARERFSRKLRRALALPVAHIQPDTRRSEDDDEFDLMRLVPEFRDLKQKLQQLVETTGPKIERLRLTPTKGQSAKKILEIFHQTGLHQVDGLAGRLDGLIRDVEGPARQQWEEVSGFEQRWTSDVRECRNLINNAARLRDDLDYFFGKLLEARYAEVVPAEYPTTRSFYEGFIAPRRKVTGGGISKSLVLVIDSMRFDMWHQLIRPGLERDYQVEETIAFAELPSETRVSRTSFFAGKAPGQLPRTVRETDLFAELLFRVHGQAQAFDDLPEKRPGLRYISRSRDKLTLTGVFDFADAVSHRIDWNPHTMQQALSPLVREIRALLKSEGPETLVFITSDHGHHLHEGGAAIFLDDATDVGYRSAYTSARVEGQHGQHVFQIPAATLGHSLPGLFVFPRPRYYLRSRAADQHSGRPGAGYRHGGLSLYEVAIPLVCLRHRSAPTSVLVTLHARGALRVGEEAAIEVSLTADGLIHSPVRLAADTEDVQSVIVSDISPTPTIVRMRYTPASPGRGNIKVTAYLGEQDVGSQSIDLEVAGAPVQEDEAVRKLKKMFGND